MKERPRLESPPLHPQPLGPNLNHIYLSLYSFALIEALAPAFRPLLALASRFFLITLI